MKLILAVLKPTTEPPTSTLASYMVQYSVTVFSSQYVLVIDER